MASVIMHISIAKKINEKLRINEKQLFLGVVAPDIAKFVGLSRMTSHFQKEDYDDLPNLDEFLEKYHQELNNPFILGYYIHLYSDRLWNGDFIKKYISGPYAHLNNGTDIQLENDKIYKLVYHDYEKLNIALIEEYDLDLSLFYEDFPLPKTSLDEIPIDQLPEAIHYYGDILKDSIEGERYIIDLEEVTEYINKSADIIYNDLKKLLENTN